MTPKQYFQRRMIAPNLLLLEDFCLYVYMRIYGAHSYGHTKFNICNIRRCPVTCTANYFQWVAMLIHRSPLAQWLWSQFHMRAIWALIWALMHFIGLLALVCGKWMAIWQTGLTHNAIHPCYASWNWWRTRRNRTTKENVKVGCFKWPMKGVSLTYIRGCIKSAFNLYNFSV